MFCTLNCDYSRLHKQKTEKKVLHVLGVTDKETRLILSTLWNVFGNWA